MRLCLPFILFIAGCISISADAAPSTAFSVTYAFNSQTSSFFTSRFFNKLHREAITQLNLKLNWSEIEPNPGEFSQDKSDELLKTLTLLQKNGFKTSLFLYQKENSPTWFNQQGGWFSPDSPRLFLEYTQYLLKKTATLTSLQWVLFSEPVDFTPHNENNFEIFCQMARAHRIAADAIHSVNTKSLVGIELNFSETHDSFSFLKAIATGFAQLDFYERGLPHLDLPPVSTGELLNKIYLNIRSTKELDLLSPSLLQWTEQVSPLFNKNLINFAIHTHDFDHLNPDSISPVLTPINDPLLIQEWIFNEYPPKKR